MTPRRPACGPVGLGRGVAGRLRRCGSGLIQRRGGPERGSAVVEFVVLGLLLLVPLIYLVLMMARLQAGAYAVSMAGREAGRVFVTAPDETSALARADAAARIALADHRFGPEESTVQITCTEAPCLTPGGAVRVHVAVQVPLPLVPAFARGAIPLQVPVSADALATVDTFRGAS